MAAVVLPAESVPRQLLEWGLLTPEAVAAAAARTAATQDRFTAALVRSGALTGDELFRRLTRRAGGDRLEVDGHALQPSLLSLIPEAIAVAAEILPLHRSGQILWVAVPPGWRHAAELPRLDSALGVHCEPVPVETVDVPGLLLKGLQLLRRRARVAPIAARTDPPEVGPRSFDAILDRAAALRADELHLVPLEEGAEVRFRIDGRLRPSAALGFARGPVLRQIAELRAAAGAEGRFRRGTLEVRLLPYGEAAVLRLRDGAARRPGLRELGWSEPVTEAVGRALAAGRGLVLVAGPARSGRTTTLEAMTGADVFLAGDLRDREGATEALRRAVAGCLVLASVEAEDATGAVPAMRELGADPTMLSMGLALSVAQRLVRRICADCRRAAPFDPAELEDLGLDGVLGAGDLHRGAGCPSCDGDGHRGRAAIAEAWAPDEELRREFGASPGRLRSLALARGLRPLAADGLERVRAGVTTLAELRDAVPFAQLVQARDLSASIP